MRLYVIRRIGGFKWHRDAISETLMGKLMSRFFLARVAATLISVGCLTSPAVAGGGDDAKYDEAVPDSAAGYRVLQKSFLTQRDLAPGGFFVSVHFENNQWVVDGVTEKMPVRKSRSEEIFYISQDKSRWYLAIPDRIGQCSSDKAQQAEPYTVCTSAFGSFSGAGAFVSVLTSLGSSMLAAKPTTVDSERLKKAVYSVSEGDLNKQILAVREVQQQEEEARAQKRIAELTKAQEKRAVEDAKAEQVRVSRKKAPAGAKDFCQGRTIDTSPSSPAASYECQNYGYATFSDLKSEGWIIVNTMPRSLNNGIQRGMVTDIVIEKLR
jgi:hypothetical protein